MSKYRTHTFLSVELQCVRVQWCTRPSPRVCCYCCCLNTIQIGTRHTTPTKVTHKLVYLLLLPLKCDSNREKLSHSGRKHILPAQFIIIPLSLSVYGWRGHKKMKRFNCVEEMCARFSVKSNLVQSQQRLKHFIFYIDPNFVVCRTLFVALFALFLSISLRLNWTRKAEIAECTRAFVRCICMEEWQFDEWRSK